MVTRADSMSIRPVASTEATQRVASIADARQQSFDQFTPASIGKLFKAQVLSSLTDGSFTVKLQDSTTVQMNLPTGTQIGDKLELTLIGTQPRPTFSMPASGNPATTTSADLSQTGKLIDNILRTAQTEGNTPTLVGKTILVTSPDASPAQVASALKDTVSYSGLFYESHVSQWATGTRPLADLMREPQAKFSDPKLLSAAAQQTPAQTETSADDTAPEHHISDGNKLPPEAATLPARIHTAEAETAARILTHAAAEPSLPDTEKPTDNQQINAKTDAMPPQASQQAAAQSGEPSSPAPAASNPIDNSSPLPSGVTSNKDTASPSISDGNKVSDSSTSPISTSDSSSAPPEAVHNETMRMVSLQLDTLENQRLMWRGEVWPGQQMEWEISEDSSGRQGNSGESDRAWQSTLRVELPSLGAVAATIRLHGQHVQVQVRAASEDTASLLRTHGNKLASALDAAGSPLDQLSVRQDAAT